MNEIDPNRPINNRAKEAVSKSREKGNAFDTGVRVSSMVKLPTLMYRGNPSNNLTGIVFDRMTVIGIYAGMPYKKNGTNTGARWVVRCACGRYEVRSTKGIKNILRKNTTGGKCRDCQRSFKPRVEMEIKKL